MGKDIDFLVFWERELQGLLRASQIVVRSEEVRSNVGKLMYAGKNAHQKSANSNETARRTPEGGLGQHRTM